jgi:hypothetical protein
MAQSDKLMEQQVRETRENALAIKEKLEKITPLIEKHVRALYGGNRDTIGLVATVRGCRRWRRMITTYSAVRRMKDG